MLATRLRIVYVLHVSLAFSCAWVLYVYNDSTAGADASMEVLDPAIKFTLLQKVGNDRC